MYDEYARKISSFIYEEIYNYTKNIQILTNI